MQNLIYANAALTVVLLAACIVMGLMLRRIRRLFQEIAPVGALTSSRGPQPGDACPPQPFHTLAGGVLALAGGAKPRLVLFVSATCPISRKVIPIARNFCGRENLELVLAGMMPQPFNSTLPSKPTHLLLRLSMIRRWAVPCR